MRHEMKENLAIANIDSLTVLAGEFPALPESDTARCADYPPPDGIAFTFFGSVEQLGEVGTIGPKR